MKQGSFKLFLSTVVVIFSALVVHSSPSLNDFIKVETRDMDSDTTTNWMRLHKN